MRIYFNISKLSKQVKFIAFIGLMGPLWPVFGDDHSTPKPTLQWDFTETGLTPKAVDSSGNHFDGTSSGSVTGNGSRFAKFDSVGSYVSYTWSRPFPPTLASDVGDLWIEPVSFVANFSHPGISATNLIARGGSPVTGATNGWQLSLSAPDDSGMRTISLTMASWGGQQLTKTSGPVKIDPTVTYQIALTWTYLPQDPNYNYVFNIYLSPADGSPVKRVFNDILTLNGGIVVGEEGATATEGDNSLIIGGADSGYYANAFPGGCFGGNMSFVKLYMGVELTPEQLTAISKSTYDKANGLLQ